MSKLFSVRPKFAARLNDLDGTLHRLFQLMLQPPPSDIDKLFYSDLDSVAERAILVRAMGFDWTSVNATAIFQAGARSVDAMVEQLDLIHARIRNEVE